MSSTAIPAFSRPRPLPAIFWGGLLAGIGDLTQAIVVFGHYSATATPFRIFQSIPRGILGAKTFQMGWTSALLGIFLHFFIATVAAAVYYFASRKLPILLDHFVLCGLF